MSGDMLVVFTFLLIVCSPKGKERELSRKIAKG